MNIKAAGDCRAALAVTKKENLLHLLTLRRDQQEDFSEGQTDYSVIHATLRSQRQRRKIC